MKIRLFTGVRRLLFLAPLAATLLTATACQDDTIEAAQPADPAAEEAVIQKYLADNNIAGAQRQPSGLYFVPVTSNPTAP